ncbi:MAG: Polyketide synthase [Gammaproteobacteria bacterium]|nr:Polyketide synthase [Gammaproteobacteria bacterium]
MSIKKEPIAIIGIGCRFPGGASNPRLFWRNLCQGIDAIVDIPADRWDVRKFYDPDPDKPGKSYAKQGGFLKEKIEFFDPLFFGISPREAETMDPQQRLLLEVTWEAIEDAGLQLESLLGSRTGVFIGGFMLDNMLMNMGPLNRELVNSHTPTSSTMTILSNRLSYVFDLHGPSVTMDTACSSSLVATHYACQSIWHDECDMAFSGGANVMLRPEYPIAMSKGQFLSEHARCMAFDERAAGYTRGEGAGIVFLKPLSRAIEDADHIYALIKMTGVNQDGRTQGISMPNADAQEQLIRHVYRQAGVAPAEIQYIEAHGTGTRAGDPKEAQALNSVLSEGRSKTDKCMVGSVKTNIGHLEAAAGIAGLIKASLCLHENKIPPNLHFEIPNPDIPFDAMCIRISTQLTDWPHQDRTRYAGVNSFGYGGTNAHVLMEQAPPPVPSNSLTSVIANWQKPFLVPISARSEVALRELAGKYAFFLSTNNTDSAMVDFLFTLSQRRTHHNHRLALVANSIEDMRNKLELVSSGSPATEMASGVQNNSETKLVFVYSGMGPQWWGMARELLERETVFRAAVEECDQMFQQEAGWSVLTALLKDEQTSEIAKTEVAQPANFVIQYALTILLKSFGIIPDAVIGHSVGEVTATCICGALTLPEAIKVSVQRSRLQAKTAGQGAMLAAGLSAADAALLLNSYRGVSIAAVNAPNSLTLSGDKQQLQSISNKLTEQNIFNRFLEVEVAYHSPQMDEIKHELLLELNTLQPAITRIKLVSTVTGEFSNGNTINNEYWWNNVRQPVQLLHGVKKLINSGYSNFLEISPHPVLAHSIREIAASLQKRAQVIPTLNRKTPDYKSVYMSLGQLYCLGFDINWHRVIPPGGKFLALPTYPWQQDFYWLESKASRQDRLGNSDHVMFNQMLDRPGHSWSVEINSQYFPFLNDHRVNTEIVFPGSAYVEAGLALHKKIHDCQPIVLTDIEFHNILLIEPKKNQILCLEHDDTNQNFNVYSRLNDDDSTWKKHASGKLIKSPYTFKKFNNPSDVNLLRDRITVKYPIEELYANLQNRGLDYGYFFKNARELWVSDSEYLVHIDCIEKLSADNNQYLLPPVLLDCAFHTLLSLIPDNKSFVPVSIARVAVLRSPPPECYCHGTLLKRNNDTLIADFLIFDFEGNVCVEIKSCVSKSLLTATDSKKSLVEKYVYLPVWEAYDNTPVATIPDNCLIFSDTSEVSVIFENLLKDAGKCYYKILPGKKYTQLTETHFTVNPGIKTDFKHLLTVVNISRISHIYYFWPVYNDPVKISAAEVCSQAMSLIYLIQACSEIENPINLVVITRGAQCVTNDERLINLNSSSFWGLLPLIENEFPNIHYKLVDLCVDSPTDKINEWMRYILDSNINDLAIRSGKPHIKKLTQMPLESEHSEIKTISVSTVEPVKIIQRKAGHVDSLIYKPFERIVPVGNQVEIKSHYAGINFKDILKIYGTIAEKTIAGTYFGHYPGMEISGTVTAVGEKVKNLQPGDEVIAAVIDGYRSYAIAPAEFVIKKPAVLKSEESLFHIVFCTAYYALVEIARLTQGEKVLIHSAAGGLGLAAIQVASMIGTEIYATASTSEKRNYLKSLGVKYVMDSRSLDFHDEILEITGGYGVDVILNTLSGEALIHSMNLLAPYGRFIEAGKADIVANTNLPMLPFNKNITFSAVDFDRMHAEKPEKISQLMKTVAGCFDNGYFKPLPVEIFKASSIIDAFRFMGQGKHIGKIVVKFVSENVAIEERANKTLFSPDGTYLIAGGTSGFGLAVARWLADQTIGRLVLISRSGAKSDECKRIIQEIQGKGVRIDVQTLDIADFNAVHNLTEKLQNGGPPLLGIFNSAMVLDDAFLKDMTEDRFMKVISPKVSGTMNLYQCTKSLKLDFFISFSSISSIVGNKGQANYVAANAFLDEFAYMARINNYPAYTINWGVLADAGVVARNREIGDILEMEGIKGLSNNTAFAAIEYVLSQKNPQIGVFDMDWSRWGKINQIAKSSRFRELIKRRSDINDNPLSVKALALLEYMQDKSSTECSEYISEILRAGMARIIKLSPEKINNTQKLDSLGVDSLILLELSIAINEEFGVDISAMELFKQPTIASLTDEIINRLMLLSSKLTAPGTSSVVY